MLDSSAFGRLRNLRSLNVHDLRCAPVDLFFLKDLAELRICNCRLAISKRTLHALFGRSKSLQLLHLKDCCNLCELPDNISGLYKLYELKLDGSSVKTLPASTKHQRHLKTLSLENCRKLRSLTELPPFVTELNAMNCRSLRTVSTITTCAMIMAKRKFISFKNCVALDEPSLHCIMEGAQLATKGTASENMSVKGVEDNTEINCNFVKVCFPGSRVPGQFKYRTTDSSITIDLLSSQSDLVGLSLCVVLSHSRVMKNLGAKIWCLCYLANGTMLGPATTWYDEAVTELNSDHVFIWYDPSHFDSFLKICDHRYPRVWGLPNI
uniref:C-JID domain-containing protein n=2 Tax=Cajanus cajan TaxID=3821 RepID=A0A151TZK6_CAJCA|nr:hypothetical protein KK1_005044 [Cajanus cajan]